MMIRHCWLDCCTILERFLSSVKDFQVLRYFISERRTKGQGTPSYLTEGQKDRIPTPNLILRQAKRLRRLPQGRGV